jgi:purine-binding chemotaxis protein CheW
VSDVHVRLRVGAELYALPIANVLEVGVLGELSGVPGSGATVLGLRNLHGRVLPVFDLARVLAIAGDPAACRIVVAEHEGRLAGLAVDEITDGASLAALTEPADAEYLSGALLEDGRLIGVIDVDRLFQGLARAAA